VGVGLNIAFADVFTVGGPPVALVAVSLLALAAGVTIWAWSIGLILTRVPRGQLITSGPYALVKHPLYTAVSLLVLPSLGLLLNTWLGVAIGVVMYGAARIFGPAEERDLARAFGPAWTAYASRVIIPWL
jgi:protein-S-isoprenylcysteine O-methyltransferase Ste14